MSEAGPYRGPAAARPEQRPVAPTLRAQLVLGNGYALIAWFILMAASVVGWGIAAQSPLMAPTIEGPTASTQAHVDGVSEHRNRVGSGGDQAVIYHFTLDGRRYQGRSWNPKHQVRPGNTHLVHYQVDDPQRSVLRGMTETRQDRASVAWFAACTVPAVLGLVLFGWLRARRTMRLLAYGRLAEGVSFVTSSPIAQSTDRWVEHSYKIGDGQTYTCRTRVDRGFEPATDPPAQILCHPAEPSAAILLEPCPVHRAWSMGF